MEGQEHKDSEKDTKTLLTDSGEDGENVPNHEQLSASENQRNSNEKSQQEEEGSSFSSSDVHYEGDLAIYTDPATKYQYEWSTEKNEWVSRKTMEYGFEDDMHTYTDKDGAKYFWDKEKSAWFPKIDDDFMAKYQMSYGFIDNKNTDNAEAKTNDVKKDIIESKGADGGLLQVKVKGEKRKASEPTWFEVDETQNTKVYVTNLPRDITEQEFIDLMQKCGLVMRDPNDGSFRIKLYKEPGMDDLKGDALCTYIKVESVALALQLLDGYVYREHKIRVEKAKFQMKGQFDPKLKPKMKKRKEKQKLKKMQEKLFDWRPEKAFGERSKHERTVIVRNLFDPAVFDTDVGLILEFQQDLREECGKIGEVRKVIIYDRHPEGVAQINMGNPEEADEVVKLLNGRYFSKRQLTAEIWDGKTKFKIAETDSQISKRIETWDKFLEQENVDESKKQKIDTEEKINE